MKRIILHLVFLILIFASCQQESENTIFIAGEWTVTLDPERNGPADNPSQPINLPGSLAEAGIGTATTGSDFGVLTPTHKYIGVAWYEREIEIPRQWEGKRVDLFLERVLWESQVFIDGETYSTQDGLGTPHIHELGSLGPGKHQLVIRVDNDTIHNIGDKGHAYGAYTQSIWNGIVGRMELQAKDPTCLAQLRTFSLIESDQLRVELTVEAAEAETATVSFAIRALGEDRPLLTGQKEMELSAGQNRAEVLIDLEGKLRKWSEFDPAVYVLEAEIRTDRYRDRRETEFGYVKIGHDGTHITINDQPVFLRGNLDCVHFPLTGYPSTRVEDWERIFRIYKDYGLNHVRFHTWCPPEAAFRAANRLGIYIQAEASVWIDWWMSEDMKVRGRPEMDTKGYPKGLGHDPGRDAFIVAEMNRMVDQYGNHPSFTMFCIGNELGNANFEVMEQWVADLKAKDPRRLYSVSTARQLTETDDYFVTHNIPGIGRTRGLNGAGADWDFEETYSQLDIPVIAHEIGQWPVYPSWEEIGKYTGVLKARNFEEFRAVAEKNGIAGQDEELRKASGALNQLLYKYETESFLRTPSCAGVQLLSMQDYQGQGEALIGWLDAHWESKGITTPDQFRSHFDETVPLLRMEKFVWTNDETFEARAELFHYGESDMEGATMAGRIRSADGALLKEARWPLEDVPRASLIDVGTLSLPLNQLDTATQLTISLQLEDTPFHNEWNIWVYPAQLPALASDDILIAEELSPTVLSRLRDGGKVLLLASQLGTAENSTLIDFYPLYWSLTFFPGQGKTSLGLLIREEHPALKYFPTSYHSDWQWEPFGKTTRAFILNDLPVEYRPIVQVVDDFHRNNKEGAVFEWRVGEGKLLVCGFDVENVDSPVARQLKYSLLRYMKSPTFEPEQNVEEAFLRGFFPEAALEL